MPDLSSAAMRENFQLMQPLAPPRPATKRVLIVEDNPLNMKLLRDVLEAFGYETITTGEGMEGVTLACEQQPDLILMDLQLPDISGYDAVRRLKDHPPTRGIPVVAVTAFAMSGDERKALMSGCDAYLPKPISLRDFIETVERFIGTAEARR
jgi:two-component system cell cycle response regulator DivK